jgi:hypothetical protein
MEEKVKNSLEMIQETKKAAVPPDSNETKKEEGKKAKFEIPDGYLLAQEMKDLFEEDVVTHVQGPSEPEGD